MRIQGTYFNIRKISYPNSNTRHGKLKIDLLQQDFERPQTFALHLVKEGVQAMSHEKLLISTIGRYRHINNLSMEHPNVMLEIFTNHKEKEGTGPVCEITAHCFKMGQPNMKFFELKGELSPIK
jgi:hypothetical protein